MAPKFFIVAFFFILSIAHRDESFTLCARCFSSAPVIRPEPQSQICAFLSQNLNTMPALYVCCHRRLLPLPPSRLTFASTFLLLLAGDVSVNPGPSSTSLRMGTLNVRSIRDKGPAVSDLVTSKKIDILAITETWLSVNETTAGLAEIVPPGFNIYQIPRTGRRGGGVGFLISSSLKFTEIALPPKLSFEAIMVKIDFGLTSMNVLNVYRPPGTTAIFFEELQEILSYLAILPNDLVLLGDFNIHVDTPSSVSDQFNEILASFDLTQCVNFPTHIHGHTLDLMAFSAGCSIISVSMSDRISDHFLVLACLNIPVTRERPKPERIQYRKIKAINIQAFKDDLKNSNLIKKPSTDIAGLTKQYDDVLRNILDAHAPLHTKNVSRKPPNPWMTPDILAAKRYRRYLERVWRKNPTPLNRSRLTRQTHLCNRKMNAAKSAHYSEIIHENSDSQRNLWKAFNKILHRCPPVKLPDSSSIISLAESFGSFFVDKISVIRSAFQSELDPLDPPTGGLRTPKQRLCALAPATEAEVRRLVLSAPCKSSGLDPIPTALLKTCIDVLATPITSIVNLSLSKGIFPHPLRQHMSFPF